MYSKRYRGTPESPGLVLGLNRGGACRGIAFQVAQHQIEGTLKTLWEREMSQRTYSPRLVHVDVAGARVRALAFIADPTHASYAGHLSIEQTAERIANCRGARGPNLEYLIRTVEHLSELGVRDHNLLRVLAAARASGNGAR